MWELAKGAEKARFDFDTELSFCAVDQDEQHVLIEDSNSRLHVLELVW